MKKTLIITLFITYLCASCAFANSTLTMSNAKQQKLNRLIDSTIKKFNLPGAIIGVWTPNQGFWVKTKGQINQTDKFSIASIGKTFIATVILQLIDEEKLKLDDRAYNHITVRQLCSHTSYGTWLYSNDNYVILSSLINQITGNRARNEIAKRIFEPLGLKNTYYLDDELFSNLYDLKTWAKALAAGKLVSQRSHREQLKWIKAKPEGKDVKYGLGIMNVQGFVGHEGQTWGGDIAMYYHPKRDITIIVYFNKYPSECGRLARETFKKIARIVLAK